MEPKILFEDEDVVVVDKPSGMIVYPDGKHDYPALSAWLEQEFGMPARLETKNADAEGALLHEKGFHFVHRIDRETSGVLVIAKNAEAHAFLKEQFQEREVRKIYRAFVYGVIKDDRGVIDKPIGSARGGKGPRSALRPHGEMREALTTFRVITRSVAVPPEAAATYLEVMPKTGRTHQIRVHLASIQRPIICDPLYAPGRSALLGFNRLALHAFSVTLKLLSGEERTFTAPLPADFLAAEEKLR